MSMQSSSGQKNESAAWNLEAKARGGGHYRQMLLRGQSWCPLSQSSLWPYKNEDYQWAAL